MISVEEARDLVLQHTQSYGIEAVHLLDSIGRVLAEDVIADRAFPPFDRVCMDGIAIQYDTYAKGHRVFQVENIGAAGKAQQILKDPLKCIEIMTGAPLPMHTDTIVRYEDLKSVEGAYKINQNIQAYTNIHAKAKDHEAGSVILKKFQYIKPIDINVLASVGKNMVKVLKLPKVAVISSGEELVEVNQIPKDHQIRRSNVYMLMARLRELGIPSSSFHFKDDSIDIYNQLKAITQDFDVFLISGGVSAGKFDFIPSVLEHLKFKKLFHKVKQRPGKPFWFGIKNKKLVFAFPGNPVSTLACFHKYFIPWYNASLSTNAQETIPVKLGENILFRPDLHYFAQAHLQFGLDGILEAFVTHGNGSGDLVSPTHMQGFLELPAGKESFLKGEVYNFIPFSSLFR